MRRPILVAAALILVAGALAALLRLGGLWGGEVPRPRRIPAPTDSLDAHRAAADAATGARLFTACAACHSVGRGGADVDGPNLYGVVGSRVAERRPRYNYSAALRNAGGTWTAARLDAWLTNPAIFAPGTTMGFPGLPDPQDRADVIAFLAGQSPKPPR